MNAMSAMNAPQLSRKVPELIFAGGMVRCHGNGAGLAVWYAMHGICNVHGMHGMACLVVLKLKKLKK